MTPPWWPPIRHAKPDYLYLYKHINLLVHIAGLIVNQSPAILQGIDFNKKPKNAEKRGFLTQLFCVLYAEERYRQGELGASATVCVNPKDNDNKDSNSLPCQTQAADPKAQICYVGNTYRIGRQIGKGTFGVVFSGTSIISGEVIAIKFEDVKAKQPQIGHEARIYKTLAGGTGIPRMHWFGTESNYNAMAIDLLRPSLEDLFNRCNRQFSLKTTLLLADQLILRIEYIHSKSFIYRDFKPENVMMGIANSNIVYMIDFGTAKAYCDPQTGLHIPYRENKSLTGTSSYVSINTHLGIEQSRRDDMESIGYIMLYFYRGSLPWQDITAPTLKQKYNSIMQKKMTTTIEDLCSGIPDEFATFLKYTRILRFDQKPDYSYLRKIFRDLFTRRGFHLDYVFDWIQLANKSELHNISN
ncbi:hypothetical protein VE02_08921 [Pseudogymnoascus sp. 03VT05]|nr:hypothetical protein VE02_08921 [Pseudogymnoascus sp. 03VT05]